MNKVRSIVADLMCAAGAAGITYGSWMLHPAAGWIVGGVFCVVGAFVIVAPAAVDEAQAARNGNGKNKGTGEPSQAQGGEA